MNNARAPVPSVSDIFTLTAAQQNAFFQYFNHPDNQVIEPHERVYQYLSKLVAGFDYQGQNYTARQAFSLQQGNCITLAVLTKALADLAGVDISFQQMVSAPVFGVEQDWFITSDHVRTFLFASPPAEFKRVLKSFRSFIVVDYFPAGGDVVGQRLSESTFIAMYYRNLAADAVLEGQYEHALALLREALHYAPDYAAVINLTALVHKHIGQRQLAKQWYLYGLHVAEHKATLLSNYAVLSQSDGDHDTAKDLRKQLAALQEQDPYLWYVQGKTALVQQNGALAVTHFQRLTKRAPYVSQFHLELAKAYYLEQRFADARVALADAADLAQTSADKLRFNAKLDALSRHVSVY